MRQASEAIAQNLAMHAQMKRASELTKSAEKQLAIEKTNAKFIELIKHKDDQEDRRRVQDGIKTFYMNNIAKQEQEKLMFQEALHKKHAEQKELEYQEA